MTRTIEQPSFKKFVTYLKHSEQRNEIAIALLAYVIFYIILINLYPLPSTLIDSANYVYCAMMNHPGGYRPFGYSWYLNFIHSFSSSIGFVTITQFLLTALSTLFFIYTIKYFFKFKSGLWWYGFLAISILAPPTLYMAHSLLSDSLFCSLTVLWFTTAIWILFTRNLLIYAIHLLSLYWALEVRYAALFYPIFTALVVWFSFDKLTYKIGLIAVCFIVTVYFYKSTVSEMRRDFGVEVFSGFSGWLLLNNALLVVPYEEINPQEARDPETRMFLEYLAKTDKTFYNGDINTQFIWSKKSPLKEYTYWKMQTMQIDYLRSWLLCSKDFSKFGSYLIKKYPGSFLNHYMLPNAWCVIYPPRSWGVISRIEDITTDDLFHDYYGLPKGIKFSAGRSVAFSKMSPFLSSGVFLFWMIFLASSAFLAFKWKVIKQEKQKFNCILFLILFALGYSGFNIFSAPFEYRYIIPIRPILVVLPLFALMILVPNKCLRRD